jgi:DNA-binding MarR family transcriptional regulator/GNAT superfamily N-acetyltransferase
MDFIKDLGYLAVATRMKRLTERLMRGAGEVYRALDIDFEPRYFAVFYLLSRSERPLSISEIASALKISHPAVIQTTQRLLKKKLVISSKDDADRRKHQLSLSPKGLKTAKELQHVWDDFVTATVDMFDETGVDILDIYQKIEDALDRREISERILNRIKLSQYSALEIKEYRPEYRGDFQRLNQSWLTEYFTVEEKDAAMLEDPEGEILKKGGFVLFALSGERVVGTVALLKADSRTYELAKMAVYSSFRRKQAGRRLADAAIEKARALGAESVILWTDSRLQAALALYRKLGFVVTKSAVDASPGYTRAQCGMTMRLTL